MKLGRVLVFGATSAIAQAVLRQLVAGGASVYCVGRNPARLEAVLADLRTRATADQIVGGATADLTMLDRHQALLHEAERSLGELDAVLIAHGTLPDQGACETSADRAVTAIEENGTSVISLLTIAAGYFAPRGRGVIAAISSVAGDRGRRSNYVYGASKGLVSIFMQGLRHRLASRGVHVVTVKPGFVDTPMTAAIAPKGFLWSAPEAVARDIVRAMERGRAEVYTPWFWYWIMLVLRHVPEPLFRRLPL
jgi:decaprenylphospho-beta-D-erythro-pentofuranosid-2-ulose 2-reductase